MENHQPPTAQQIIERITSDKALHDVLQPLLEEVRGLRSDIRQMRETMAAAAPPPYLTARELAQTLQVSYETVRRRVAGGEWPALMIGNQARFGPEEIAAIRELSFKRAPAPHPSGPERRARNKKIRSMPIFGQE
ncbi:helix-turn-helix domain-containing protein [Pseudarthrobacter sp. NPDC092439]|uniref:helix-turn-helix domain-containing protein n=1 Tax=unclassified Pseudarthrobacter TaxID=2647000 RepID=UPI0037F80C71